MRNLFLKQSLTIALVALCGFAYSQESVLLKYNFVQGKTYTQSTTITSNITQSMGGQEMKMQSDIKTSNDYAIEGVDKDGNATVLVSLLNLSVRSAAMGRDTTMNFNDLKDKNRTVYSPEGKTISSTKVDSSKIARMIGSIDQFIKLQTLPAKSIKVGEKWQEKIVENKKPSGSNPFAVDNTTDMEFTLVGKESKDGIDYFKISFTGTMTITGKGNQMGMELFMEGTGKTEGFGYFNPITSMIVYTESSTEMDMTIAVTGQQNMTMPMSQSMKSITKIEEKK